MTFVCVPAVTPDVAIDKTPEPDIAKGAELAGIVMPPIALAVAIGKSDATKAAVDVIKP